jgi:hypothetical protein
LQKQQVTAEAQRVMDWSCQDPVQCGPLSLGGLPGSEAGMGGGGSRCRLGASVTRTPDETGVDDASEIAYLGEPWRESKQA